MKKMNITMTFFISMLMSICLLSPALSFGQQKKDKYAQQKKEFEKRSMAAIVGHITSALDLSEAQAIKFWPIYKKHIEKIKKIKVGLRQDHRKIRDSLKYLTEKQKRQIIEKQLHIREEVIKLERNLNKNLDGIITTDQLIRLKGVEKRLRDMMHNRMTRGFQKRGKGRKSGEKYGGRGNRGENKMDDRGKEDYDDEDRPPHEPPPPPPYER